MGEWVLAMQLWGTQIERDIGQLPSRLSSAWLPAPGLQEEGCLVFGAVSTSMASTGSNAKPPLLPSRPWEATSLGSRLNTCPCEAVFADLLLQKAGTQPGPVSVLGHWTSPEGLHHVRWDLGVLRVPRFAVHFVLPSQQWSAASGAVSLLLLLRCMAPGPVDCPAWFTREEGPARSPWPMVLCKYLLYQSKYA